MKASSKKNAIKLYNKRLEVSRSYNEDAVSMKIALWTAYDMATNGWGGGGG